MTLIRSWQLLQTNIGDYYFTSSLKIVIVSENKNQESVGGDIIKGTIKFTCPEWVNGSRSLPTRCSAQWVIKYKNTHNSEISEYWIKKRA